MLAVAAWVAKTANADDAAQIGEVKRGGYDARPRQHSDPGHQQRPERNLSDPVGRHRKRGAERHSLPIEHG